MPDSWGPVLVVMLAVLAVVLVARLQDAANRLIRAVLDVPASPVRVASRRLGDASVRLTDHRNHQVHDQIAERHSGRAAFGMVGALLGFLATVILIVADAVIVMLRMHAIYGGGEEASVVDLGLLWGLIFASVTVLLIGPIGDGARVTFLTPYGQMEAGARKRLLWLAAGTFGALLLTAGSLALWSQAVINQAPPSEAFASSGGLVWNPNQVGPAPQAPGATAQPPQRDPVVDILGYLVVFNIVVLGLLGLALGKWSLGEGPLALYIIGASLVLVVLELLVAVCKGVVLLLETVRKLVTALVAIPAELGRTAWNQCARWRWLRKLLNRERQDMDLQAPEPLPSLARDPDCPLWGFEAAPDEVEEVKKEERERDEQISTSKVRSAAKRSRVSGNGHDQAPSEQEMRRWPLHVS